VAATLSEIRRSTTRRRDDVTVERPSVSVLTKKTAATWSTRPGRARRTASSSRERYGGGDADEIVGTERDGEVKRDINGVV